MAVTLGTATTFSVAANATSVDQITSSKKFVGKGNLKLYARSSATGLSCKLAVNGYAIMDTQAMPWFGATGGLSKKDHPVVEQAINGGAVELTFTNTSGGALTVDYICEFEPTR
jgi:hypothetical protein